MGAPGVTRDGGGDNGKDMSCEWNGRTVHSIRPCAPRPQTAAKPSTIFVQIPFFRSIHPPTVVKRTQ
ncbi:hypothetical protein JCM33774_89270 [Actinophytocola sp. KF-1]